MTKCLCGSRFNPTVTVTKIMTDDFMSPNSFGKYLYYTCECTDCKKKTKYYKSSDEAIEAWDLMNKKSKKKGGAA